MRPAIAALTGGLSLFAGYGSPAAAQDCRLALVLALDVSASVDPSEYDLERTGIAKALVDPEIVRLFLSGQPLAIYAFEWAGPALQVPILSGWQLITSEDDLTRAASTILTQPRIRGADAEMTTGMGGALIYASTVLAKAPACLAQVIDVSGDGRSNAGFDPRYVYAHYPFDDVRVNALVIRDTTESSAWTVELIQWFASNVLHGRGAFWIEAEGYDDFRRAIKEKLIRELEQHQVSIETTIHPG